MIARSSALLRSERVQVYRSRSINGESIAPLILSCWGILHKRPAMRYVFAGLALLMLLFVLVQYNDPDGPLWMVFYGVPAVFAGIAWMRPQLLAGTTPLMLLA